MLRLNTYIILTIKYLLGVEAPTVPHIEHFSIINDLDISYHVEV